MIDDDKALSRLYTMDDWLEFPGFNAHQVLEELKPFNEDWKRYNPNKPNNRWGLSITSIDGGLSGIPDLTSLRDYEIQTGQEVKNENLDVPTPVWTQSTELKKLLDPWKKWLTRCHFLRMDRGSFFPDHFDVNKEDFGYDEIRLVGFVKCNEYNFKWI